MLPATRQRAFLRLNTAFVIPLSLLFGMRVIPSVGVSRSRGYLFINFYRAYSHSTPAYYFLRYAPCGRFAPLVGMTFLLIG